MDIYRARYDMVNPKWPCLCEGKIAITTAPSDLVVGQSQLFIKNKEDLSVMFRKLKCLVLPRDARDILFTVLRLPNDCLSTLI